MLLTISTSFLTFFLACSGFSTAYAVLRNAPESPVKEIAQFNGLKAENLAVRPNGQVILTISAPSALLYQVDPLSIRNPIVIEHFPGTAGAFGIVELKPDVFYVASGNFSLVTSTTVPNSSFIFEVDMSRFAALPDGTIVQPPAVRKVASIPKAALLNGMASVYGNTDFVLIADTFAGLVWKADINTGTVTIAIQDPTMQGSGPKSAGINGIKVYNGYLYYTNTGKAVLYRIPIFSDGTAAGSAQVVSTSLACDDFILDHDGVAYVAEPANVITRVDTSTGQQSIVAGIYNSTSSPLVGPTAVRFGRLDSDRTSLYVTKNGGAFNAVNGTQGLSRVDLGDVAQLYELV